MYSSQNVNTHRELQSILPKIMDFWTHCDSLLINYPLGFNIDLMWKKTFDNENISKE